MGMDVSGVTQYEPGDVGSHSAAILASSHDAVMSQDMQGTITYWNVSAERVFGFSTNEALGQSADLILPPDRIDEEHFMISKLVDGEDPGIFEAIRCRKDGSLINVSMTLSPVFDKAGKICGVSKIVRDISDKTRSENSLRVLNEKKDEFIANISHELRSPMNAVVGLTSILMQSNPLTEKQSHYLEALKISSDNLLNLINDVLDFSKLEEDAIMLEEVQFNLFQVIEKIKLLADFRAREKKIGLFVTYDETLSHDFIGDPLRLHQVVNNLVTNALKFTDHGSINIDVSMVPGNDHLIQGVIIAVRDTGIGIEKDKQQAIFEKFTQADTTIARRYGGTGLGLSICKTLIHKMGGTIQVESEPGRGSLFTVTIPLRKSDREKTIVPIMSASPHGHKNVLIVEDHESNALVTSILLEEYGLTYDMASNGLDALRKFKKTNYDIILMDIQMPELDGIDTAMTMRKIEREEALSHTPIIAMTAHVMEKDKSKCLSAGMDEFLSKPFERGQLFEKIGHFLHQGKNPQTRVFLG